MRAATTSSPQMSSSVRTRRVHYLSGFDPRGARYYHRLYREESAKQSLLSSARIEVGGRRSLGASVSAWQVSSDWGGERVEVDYQFMGWDDIVRREWNSPWQLFTRSLPVYLKYILIGGFHQVARSSRNAFLTSVFPLWYLFALGVIVLLAGGAAGGVVCLLGLGWSAVIAVAVLTVLGLGWLGYRRVQQKGILWLLRTCIFVVRWGSRPLPEIDGRVREMAGHILRTQTASPVDEVLIVGHSIGTMVALCLVARLLEDNPEADWRQFHFVTLGQCIPYLGVMREARAFRKDVATVSRAADMAWTDFTAPPDPLCFYKINPAVACEVEGAPEDRPKQLVVRIFRMFSAGSYARIRKDKLRIHFQYLMASELPSDYDYFRITSGPRSMHEYSTGSTNG